MADAQGADAGNVVGNHYDKYGTANPVARLLMRGFLGAVTDLFDRAGAATVLEVGCGEGRLASHLMRHAARRPERFLATDVSLQRLAPLPEPGRPAHGDAAARDPAVEFQEASVYALPFEARSFDLVVCCEVLEHLADPERGLREVARVARGHVLLSTPREPLWRALNMARGKYWSALGNTPGHVQHWGRRGLVRLASRELDVLDVRSPVPWTVVLGRPRG